MKYAIIGVAVFALTCIGWTTVLVKRAPPSVAPPAPVVAAADTVSVAHDDTQEVQQVAPSTSTLADERADTAQATDTVHTAPAGDAALGEPSVTEEVNHAETVVQPTQVAEVPAAASPAPVSVVATGPTEEEKQAAYKALARIFSQMKAEEAAEVLRHMSDVEVEGVVRNLGARKAAEVLTSLPEQRAAALARRLLIPVDEISR